MRNGPSLQVRAGAAISMRQVGGRRTDWRQYQRAKLLPVPKRAGRARRFIYVDTSKRVGDPDHLKVFANADAADARTAVDFLAPWISSAMNQAMNAFS